MILAISLGIALMICGALIVLYPLYGPPSERQARRAEAIVTESPSARRQRLMVAVSTPGNADCVGELVAELLATPRIPVQRDGGAS